MPYLRRAPYEQVLADQLAARERVWAGAPGTLILCEHEPVITLGRSANRANVLASDGRVPIVQIERGGDVTYHGPGQLMVYPIVRITSVVAFLETIAGALADTCVALGAPRAEFRRDPAGLWLGDAKLAACGIHVARGVSVHGWALNVATPHDAWRMINPCGLGRVPQISLAELIGRPIDVADVAADLEPRLARVLL
jgi:lipoyl(octanoyl) transferase